MKKILSAILILLYCICSARAQNSSGSLNPEKIYLHTNRDIYIAGENLFYSLYLLGNPDQMSKYAYLIIRNENNLFITNIRLEINNQVAYGTIFLSDTLNSGVYQIVCYTNCMRNYSEDSYYKKEIIIANRFDEKMNLFADSLNHFTSDSSFSRNADSLKWIENLVIHSDKKVFNQREKISFSIESAGNKEDSISYLSVSVSEIVPGDSQGLSITEYIYKSNFLKTRIGPDMKNCSYSPEFNGTVIQGKVLPLSLPDNQSDSVKRIASKGSGTCTLLISTADSISNLQYTSTDSSGRFKILLNPYYEGKDLYIRIKENLRATIEPDTKFSLIQPFDPSDKFNFPGLKSFLVRSSKIAQVQKFYNEQVEITREKEFLPGKIVPGIYYDHYSTIFPSDFIDLPDFAELSKEIIPFLKVRKTGGKFVAGYVNFLDEGRINTGPAIFLDGVPIDDVNQIINLGSNQIRRIETLPVTRYFGELSLPGILAVFSKDLVIENIQFKTPTIKFNALSSQSYTKPVPFNPVDNRKHIPDLRQLLLWEPDIILHKNEIRNIECFASDLTGNFLINIQGITSKGNPVYGSAIITIKSK